MEGITRESHYVPQATLRRSDDGHNISAYRILVSHRNVPEWKRYPIKSLTRQPDLYTTFDGDHEGDEFEKFVTREIEEPGQAAIETLLAHGRMTPRDWIRIAKFAAAQQLRTPLFFVEWVKRLNEQLPDALAATLEQFGERDAASATDGADARFNYIDDRIRVSIERPIEPGRPALVSTQVSSSRTLWLRFMRHILTNRTDVTCKHCWRTLEPAADEEWPLTDHPVLTLNFYGPGRYDFGAGWDLKGSEFILPVSPRLAVFTQVGSRDRGHIVLTPERTQELRRMMVERALRWVIARKPAPWVSAARPRVVDDVAYAAEQQAWRDWHAAHVDDEARFREQKTPPATP